MTAALTGVAIRSAAQEREELRSSGFCRDILGGTMVRKSMAELLGTGLLGHFGVGVATLSFGP